MEEETISVFEYEWSIDSIYGYVEASCMKEAIQKAIELYWMTNLSESFQKIEIRIQKIE